MIVILKWYATEGHPELEFYPIGDRQAGDIVHMMAAEFDKGKECLAYVITDLKHEPYKLYPSDERLDVPFYER